MHGKFIYKIEHSVCRKAAASQPFSLTDIEVADRKLIAELERELTNALDPSSVARPSRVGHGVVVAVLARARITKINGTRMVRNGLAFESRNARLRSLAAWTLKVAAVPRRFDHLVTFGECCV